MRSKIAALVLTALLGSAAPAAAAPTVFTFLNGGTTISGGYYVGQYSGFQSPPGVTVLLNCVDFFHHVAAGDVWNATLTPIANPGGNIGTVTRFNSLAAYKQAAYLTQQYANVAGLPGQAQHDQDVGDIQRAIWSLFPDNAPPITQSPALNAQSTFWVNSSAAYYAANTNYINNNPNNANAYAGYYIVTDVNSYVSGVDNPHSVQEFIIFDPNLDPGIVVTPEPASLALLVTGLVLVGYRARRKTKV